MVEDEKQTNLLDLIAEFQGGGKEPGKPKKELSNNDREEDEETVNENGEKVEKVKAVEEYNGGTKDEWVSTFYKALRLGDADLALKTYMIMREKFRISDWYVIGKLQGCIAEDGSPSEVARLLPFLQVLEEKRVNKTLWLHHVWHAIFLVAKATKWYMTEEGHELEKYRHGLLFKTGGPENDVCDYGWGQTKLPAFALDAHTKRGRILEKKGIPTDGRLGGGWRNRWNVANRWRDLKKANPDKTEAELRKMWITLHHDAPDNVYEAVIS